MKGKRQWRALKRVLAILGQTDILVQGPGMKTGVQPKTLMRLQDGQCYLCAQPMATETVLSPYGKASVHAQLRTRDHVIPKARSGPNRRNVLLAHHVCNGLKGERLPHPCELIYLAAINARLDAEL